MDRATRLIDRLRALEPNATTSAENIRIVRAPGRVNLMGEHTDYNLGYVLPAAINLETWIASVPRDDGQVRIVSLQQPDEHSFNVYDPGSPMATWRDYVAGVAISLRKEGVALRGVTAVVDSDIPPGAGPSSSAALEMAAAWTLSEDVPPPLEASALARAAQRAENEYVGVQCGLMDQFAAAFGRPGHALLIDCRTYDRHSIPLPPGLRLVAIDTKTPHDLRASVYNARREQCEAGVAALAARHEGVTSLRDVSLGMLREASGYIDDETLRRCRHVVEENDRVLAVGNALANNELDLLPYLFAESHASLRDDYEVSSPELDVLVDIAAAVPGVIGARMTGAGLGGCTINLVEEGALDRLREAVATEYPRKVGHYSDFYVLETVSGAGIAA